MKKKGFLSLAVGGRCFADRSAITLVFSLQLTRITVDDPVCSTNNYLDRNTVLQGFLDASCTIGVVCIRFAFTVVRLTDSVGGSVIAFVFYEQGALVWIRLALIQ